VTGIDNSDQPQGRIALANLLAGGQIAASHQAELPCTAPPRQCPQVL
jgi:hypothetical protein